MPKHISNYSLEALERELEAEIDVGGLDETVMVKRSQNEYISGYSRHRHESGGYTVISYSRCLRPSFHVTAGFMTLGLSLPFTLAVDAAKRLGLGKYTHYFHTAKGDELGTSKEEAMTRARQVGEGKMRDGQYEEARSYFNAAYYLCDDSREEGFKERRDDAAAKATEEEEKKKEERKRQARERQKKEKQARERQERERQERERQARERQERERQARERQERERQARERQERERQERERQARERQAKERQERKQKERQREAKAAYQRAQELWSEAFILENNNSAANAKQKFEESHKLFKKATTLMPHVTLYKNWFQICSLKLEGDSLFNEAVTLQEQGHLLRQEQKYVEALEVYEEALKKYKEGYEISKDTRFEACIEFVESCIREVDEIIQEGDMAERLQRVAVGSTEINLNNAEDRNETLILHQVIDS